MSDESKLVVLNARETLMAVSKAVNRARGSTPYAELTHLLVLGVEMPIPPAILSTMRAREQLAATLLQRRINELLSAEATARGLPPLGLAAQVPSLTRLWRLLELPISAERVRESQ